MFNHWKKKSETQISEFDRRVLPGVPDINTGRDTTYGVMRAMATEVRDETARTAVEEGLAISILAIIEDFEKELEIRDAQHQQ